MKVEDIHRIYFVGIGGIGMSAMARYFRGKGAAVFGYDMAETALTRKLVEEGMHIHYEDDPDQIPEELDLAVYTPALPEDHGELSYLRESGIPLIKRAELLGIISRTERTVAIAGTHGKTTTTSMLSWILTQSGLDCTAYIGGIAANFQSNFHMGTSEWMVVEADEYDYSFLHLQPERAAILSMEMDHVEIFGSEENVIETAFKAFARKVVPGGRLYVQHRWVSYVDVSSDVTVRTFGLGAGDYRAENVRVDGLQFVFDLHTPEHGLIEAVRLSVPGRHNVENATAALAIALELGVDPGPLKQALVKFQGVQRRFEIWFRRPEVAYINDYAHHPTELRAVIQTAREFFPGRRIKGVFEPHSYTRVQEFAKGYAEELDELDEVYLMPIYPGREEPIPGVTSMMIKEHMKKEVPDPLHVSQVMDRLRGEPAGVWMTLGAGVINTLIGPICEYLEEQYGPNELNKL